MPVNHGSPLFHKQIGIFSAPFTSKPDAKQEFPFRISFPETGFGGPLPPTFSHAFAQFPDTVDLTVRYRVGVSVSTPGVDVKAIVPEHGKQPEVRFDVPRSSLMNLNTKISIHTQKSVVSTHMLLPEEDRPQGFQQRVRAVFNSSPQLTCEISCTEMQHIWAGYRPSFTIGIRRSEGEATNLSFPETSIVSFRADLMAYTWCDSSKRLKGPFDRFESRTVQKLESRAPLPLQLTKATDYSIILTTGEVEKWPTSFKHPLLVRRYFVKVRMKMKVAMRSVAFTREFEVKMVTRPEDVVDEVVEAGPSNGVIMPPPPYSGSDLEAYRE